MKATELIEQLKALINEYGDLECVHFEKDTDGDVCIDVIRTCQREECMSENYFDMRKNTENKEVILIY